MSQSKTNSKRLKKQTKEGRKGYFFILENFEDCQIYYQGMRTVTSLWCYKDGILIQIVPFQSFVFLFIVPILTISEFASWGKQIKIWYFSFKLLTYSAF